MLLFLCIFSLSSLGFIALACSMSKHQKQIFNTELNNIQSQYATVIGWLLLILALALGLAVGSISNMLSYWIATLSFAALLVALSLSYCAAKVKPIAIGCTVIAILSGFLHFMR